MVGELRMIIIQLAGGLGNQLQQYALYRKLVSLGKEVRLDLSWFEEIERAQNSSVQESESRNQAQNSSPIATMRQLELRNFEGLSLEACSSEEKVRLIGSDGLSGKLRRKLLPSTVHWFHENKIYHPEIFTFEEMYLSGYFACEKYYADILGELRNELRFPESTDVRNRQFADEMRRCNSVSLHIRRGDYLNPENVSIFGNICTEAYYEAALRFMKEKVPDARFYIFSDDLPYVRQKYVGEEYTIVDINHGENSFYDMWLMSNCKHHICANSTFSFWGARLGSYDRKLKIRPTIHKNSQVFVKEEMQELWKGWTFVSPEGEVYT